MRNQLKLSPKTKTTVSVKNSLLYASVGVGLFILVFTGAFFYLNMGNSEKAYAASDYISRDNNRGDWTSGLSWMGNTSPGTSFSKDTSVDIYGYVERTGDIAFNKGGILNIFDTLFITGDLFLSKDATLNIGSNGVLVIVGNYTSEKDLILANGGKIVITGEINIAKDAAIDNKGSIYFFDNSPTYGSGLTYTGSPIGNESTLANSDPALYNFVQTGNTLLPIVLDYFTAQTTASNTVLVEWGTVSEKENDFFTLEHSTDGKTFEIVTTVEGAGNSNQKLQYSFEDHKSSVGMNYYRLKQTDYNGDFEYFKIVGVNNSIGSSTASKTTESFKISEAYPNPFRGEINLNFEAEVNSDVEVLIQNARGEIVHKEIVPVTIGENNYQFSNAELLPPGVYYINLWNNGKKYKPQRLIKI